MLIQAVIFDMDGLMLDTEPLYKAAWQQASVECGYELSDQLYLRLIGHNRRDAEKILFDTIGPQFLLDLFRSKCKKHEIDGLAMSPLPKKPGLDELLDFLDSRTVPKAVATSTDRQIAVEMLDRTRLLERFDFVNSADEVANGKPSPDIFLLAAERMHVEPSACLVLEDSEPGVVAAHRAGMQVFVVPDQRSLTPSTQRLGTHTFHSLSEVTRYLQRASVDSTQLRG